MQIGWKKIFEGLKPKYRSQLCPCCLTIKNNIIFIFDKHTRRGTVDSAEAWILWANFIKPISKRMKFNF